MRTCLSFAVVFAVVALGAAPASARPPSLTGEVLAQHIPYTGSITGVCTPSANGLDYSFSFTGTASGPYPGSFTEQIQVSTGPAIGVMPLGTFPDGSDPGAQNPSQFLPAAQLLSVNASFTISSTAGAVTGTKTLTSVVPADFRHAGVCSEFQNAPAPGGSGTVTGAYKDVRAFGLSYTATITTGEGSFSDNGSSDLQGRQGKATNDSGGSVVSDVNDLGQSFDSAVPQLGKTVNVEVVRGTVLLSQKGHSFVPLTGARQIRVGSFLDTRHGEAKLTTATNQTGGTQSGNFYDGRFQVRQGKANPLTELRLAGSSFRSCKATSSQATTARRRRTIRRLWGNAHGRFRTRGRYSSATVRGTRWLEADRCDGTLTKVRRGKVLVRDFKHHKNILVKAGRSYIAKARR